MHTRSVPGQISESICVGIGVMFCLRGELRPCGSDYMKVQSAIRDAALCCNLLDYTRAPLILPTAFGLFQNGSQAELHIVMDGIHSRAFKSCIITERGKGFYGTACHFKSLRGVTT